MVYLARAFKHTEPDLVAALAGVGLHVPENANEKPVKTTIGGYVYWVNKDSRGGIWINGDEVRGAKPVEAPAVLTEASSAPVTAEVAVEATPSVPEALAVVPEAPAASAVVEPPAKPAPESVFEPTPEPVTEAEPLAEAEPVAEAEPESESDESAPKAKAAKPAAKKSGGTRAKTKKTTKEQ
jgi:outer membrane biosynthesis protein TonB